MGKEVSKVSQQYWQVREMVSKLLVSSMHVIPLHTFGKDC